MSLRSQTSRYPSFFRSITFQASCGSLPKSSPTELSCGLDGRVSVGYSEIDGSTATVALPGARSGIERMTARLQSDCDRPARKPLANGLVSLKRRRKEPYPSYRWVVRLHRANGDFAVNERRAAYRCIFSYNLIAKDIGRWSAVI